MLTNISNPMFPPCIVHETCTKKALHLLELDGKKRLSGLLKPFLSIIHQGSRWTDRGFRKMSHFYHPLEQKGLPGIHHAADELILTLSKLEQATQKQNIPHYFFHLGILLHLIQDLCVPHHVFGCLLQGHHAYENWAKQHVHEFTADAPAMFSISHPLDLMNANALTAMNYEELLHQPTVAQMREATSVLLPLAQQSSAMLLTFLEESILNMIRLSRLEESFENIPYPQLKEA